MLLVHQTGSVRVGEVVRYTLTYTPSADRILPPPTHLHVKINNASAVPLRAAYLHGPYTLYVACYPATFDPYKKHVNHQEEGSPEFEPNLKAGGSWTAKLPVPQAVREGAEEPWSRQNTGGHPKSFTWVIEVASQVLFSTTASVHFELLVGRDERSLDLGFHGVVGSGHGAPGRLEDHQQGRRRNAAQPKGVFSKAVGLVVEDTEALWNQPPFPEWAGNATVPWGKAQGVTDRSEARRNAEDGRPKQRRVHLVLLTHGLHSNVSADMLYLKESIDRAAKQAREDSKRRKEELRRQEAERQNVYGRPAVDQKTKSTPDVIIAPTESQQLNEEDEEEEEVIVRGYRGNAIKTERGIQYLGKRLAKYVLSLTYPDQPYLPTKSSISISKSLSRSLTGNKTSDSSIPPTHKHSSIVKDETHLNHNLGYKVTSISFIGHSLGGLVQTYAIAYIQKHSPVFFDLISPINFVAMATPFLGLSNENPMYVRFALDFGLVGRTGQDLGLTWRTPTLARSGWEAVIGGLGPDSKKAQRQSDPGTKPLLRILPTGPAHVALKRFRNRSVYSNVVNDGIVPLRTSCLLFLDWRGLGRVEKARRENGLVGTMVNWGWTEMTGQNASSPRRPFWNDIFGDSEDERSDKGQTIAKDAGDEVPQAEVGAGLDEDRISSPDETQFLDRRYQDEAYNPERAKKTSPQQPPSGWATFVSFFKPYASSKPSNHASKSKKIYRRGQTMDVSSHDNPTSDDNSSESSKRHSLVRGASLYTSNSENGGLEAPPKTTIFESAGDILNPPLPPREFLLDPAARPRTIWHDRVYHPGDIPPPPTKRQRTFLKRPNSRDNTAVSQSETDLNSESSKSKQQVEAGGMKIEEKIARAYHNDLSWRKVLVRLEPDAHNNMIVRRMFANAYGWPVVKHLCDTHFGYTAAAKMRDEDETAGERAEPADTKVGAKGEEVKGQVEPPSVEEERQAQRAVGQQQKKTQSLDDAKIDGISTPVDTSDLRQDIEKLGLQQESRQATGTSSKRTASEIRESRDQVSELVSPVTATGQSSYSSMLNSGKAATALSKISREDSGRWSDRIFDESDEDDEEEDEGYMREWNMAKARGEGQKTKIIDNQPLTSSPKQSTVDLTKEVSSLAGKGKVALIKDDDQARGRLESIAQAPHGPSSDLGQGNLTELGLRKSIDERLGGGGGGDENLGVAGQVALASAQRKDEESSN